MAESGVDIGSQRERVSFPGTIKGGGHEASCTMYATKVTLRGTSESAYADHSIQGLSEAVPKRNDEVTARGQTTCVRFHKGHWLAASWIELPDGNGVAFVIVAQAVACHRMHVERPDVALAPDTCLNVG